MFFLFLFFLLSLHDIRLLVAVYYFLLAFFGVKMNIALLPSLIDKIIKSIIIWYKNNIAFQKNQKKFDNIIRFGALVFYSSS